MIRTLSVILILALLSCQKQKWKDQWDKDNTSLKKVAGLLKAGKLKKVYGRGGYEIPDSFNLKAPYSNLAFHQTDFTYDGTYSIVFYLEPAGDRSMAKPAFVYTNNQKRIGEYENGYTIAKKLEDNWYYTHE